MPDKIQDLKNFLQLHSDFRKKAGAVKEKYGVDLVDKGYSNLFRGFVSEKMIRDANSRISQKERGAIPVYGDPTNQNTCAAGVCTIAADAGYDFSKMSGNINTGLATDKKGRKIPQFNPLIRSQIGRAGMIEVPSTANPEPGDWVQYDVPDEKSQSGAMRPAHLEFILGSTNDAGKYKTFNNYGLFNEGEGEDYVYDNRGSKASTGYGDMRDSGSKRFYRLSDQEAERIVSKDKDAFGAVGELEKMRKNLPSIFDREFIPGEDPQITFQFILAQQEGWPKEKVMKTALSLAKDKQKVKNVVDQLF